MIRNAKVGERVVVIDGSEGGAFSLSEDRRIKVYWPKGTRHGFVMEIWGRSGGKFSIGVIPDLERHPKAFGMRWFRAKELAREK